MGGKPYWDRRHEEPESGARGAGRQERRTVVQAIDDARRQRAGRVPPHNLEAEESLLGAMLL